MALMVHAAGYWTEDQWKLLAQQRGPRERPQADLFSKPVQLAGTPTEAPAGETEPAPEPPKAPQRPSSAARINSLFSKDRF